MRQEAAKKAADAASELEELQCSTFWRGVGMLSAQDFKVRGGSEISLIQSHSISLNLTQSHSISLIN